MRRGATLVVVGLVAAITLAAGIDALRGESSSRTPGDAEAGPPATTSTPTGTAAPEAPTPEADVGGTLYYTDENCKLRAVEVPGARPATAPNWDDCLFVLSADGERVAGAGAGWDPHSDPRRGRLFQSEDGLIQVSTNAGPEGEAFRGGAPAWKPDGTLTYFARGAVREWPSGNAVLSQQQLLRALRRRAVPGLAGFRRARVREAAWLDGRRLAAILSVDGPSGSWDVLASFGPGAPATYLDTPGRFARLRVSPAGTYFAARRGQDRLIMVERGGGEVAHPEIVGFRSIAWSPNEEWAAVATGGGVLVFRPGRSTAALALDLGAGDLAWRGGSGSPELAGADEAQAWLGRSGATGRLVVTTDEGSGCALRALRLPDLTWSDQPPGPPSLCHFRLDDSGAVLPEDVVPQPGGDETMTCRGFEDCAVAWMPDGRPAYVAGGELFAGRPGEQRSELLLSSDGLRRLLGRPAALEEVSWVDDERFWAILRSDSTANVALMTTDSLLSLPSFTTRMIEGLRGGATEMVAARTDLGVVFFDTGRRRALTFPDGRAVAWAPGEPLAAVATSNGIVFVAPETGESVALPYPVRDLEWVVP